MRMSEATFRSTLLGNERRLWLQRPALDRPAQATCILLDGEYYVERMDAPALLSRLQESRAIPPIHVVYVSHVDAPTRWVESFCNRRFARFLSDELVPWIEKWRQTPHGDVRPLLAGLSLTGLAAAHAALTRPATFSAVLCQSASFWWSDNQILDIVKGANPQPQRFRISCGLRETQDYVEHDATLIQRSSQLASNRAMRDCAACERPLRIVRRIRRRPRHRKLEE